MGRFEGWPPYPGVPYATAAKFAHPDRPVIALMGDGAMQMLGLDALLTSPALCRGLVPRRLQCPCQAPMLEKRDALQTAARHRDVRGAVRNLGTQGLADMAMSAVDNALWDLKGRLTDQPAVQSPGGLAREAIEVYGGGFTRQTVAQLEAQLDHHRQPAPPTARPFIRLTLQQARRCARLRALHAAY